MHRRLAAFVLFFVGCAHDAPKLLTVARGPAPVLPPGFVYLDQIDPSILVELRYATAHNFVGEPIAGYRGQRAVLTEKAARALTAVQAQMLTKSLTLKIYDAYRPEKAVQRFLNWSQDVDDCRMRAEFYPREDKSKFLERNYLAAHSSHTRGSAVDLTLVPVPVPAQGLYKPGEPLVDGSLPKGVRFNDNSIDMGTGFDTFDDLSHMNNPNVNAVAQANRATLREAMESHGFKSVDSEWWHYSLINEPFPETYFDFDLTD